MSEQSHHPSLDQIDALRTSEGSKLDALHVASCAACQAILADLQGLALALQQSRPHLPVPDTVDQCILWMARKQAASIKRGQQAPRTRWAIAASLLLAIGAAGLWRWTVAEPTDVATAQRDVDGNGRVDILDAFALARALKADDAGAGRWDIDADGSVDGRDVDLIAQAAVNLGKI